MVIKETTETTERDYKKKTKSFFGDFILNNSLNNINIELQVPF